MDNHCNDLIKHFISLDEKLILCGENNEFEIQLSITSAKLYSPVLKALLETKIGDVSVEDRDKETVPKLCDANDGYKRVRVDGFKYEIVNAFVKYFHGNNEIENLKWDQILSLLQLAHYYNVDNLLDSGLEKAEQLIDKNNLIEAVEFMETYGFHETWCARIVTILRSNKNVFQSEEWKVSIEKYPVTQSKIQYKYIREEEVPRLADDDDNDEWTPDLEVIEVPRPRLVGKFRSRRR